MARQRIQKHLDAARLFRCPLCGSPMEARGTSLACASGHSFDVSAKGFVTFVGNCAPLKGYDAAFFEARRRVFETGLYRPVLDAVIDSIREAGGAGPVVDAGCGEGYYAKGVQRACGRPVVGLDYAKDAIRCAARGASEPLWLVADLANIPIADGAANAVLNVFTPANYREFARILADDGILVKVVPGPGHMSELRRLARGQLKHAGYSNQAIVEHLERHATVVNRRRVVHTQHIDADDAMDAVRMSPVSFDVELDADDMAKLDDLTVDAEVIVARRIQG